MFAFPWLLAAGKAFFVYYGNVRVRFVCRVFCFCGNIVIFEVNL